ncbi:hypothetical protein J2T08_000565 [Neorhizobium galegae]|uniref:hypothetical protein n=1 Tax=Neorhizobium galegae TaxID=399 RepID=UPI00277E6D16|nr:hypothetical protein [Neorhizobium galegae]MDQ0132664.1 hypothetical protein [Neorhizobium galegae]
MSLNDQIIRQRDFSSGEIDPDAIRRDDVEVLKYAVRYARNVSTTHTGALIRRPGRTFLFEEDGIIMDFKPFDDVAYRIVFIDGGVRIRTQAGALVASLTAPWGAADLDSLVFEAMDNEIFVAWSGRTKVITIAEGTLAWSIDDYQFKTGIDNSVRVPFYRFPSTADITMLPSGVSGNITVTFSAPVLGPAHVGAIFRYAGRQFRITGYTSPTVATATVIEQLPPTFAITVGSSAGFSVGQTVETDTTNVKGEIISVVGNVVTIVARDKLTAPTTGEKLISQSAASAISAVSVAGTPGATVQWDEQFASEYRGWPRSISKDRQRLIMSNFPQFKSAIAWSATGDNRDFLIGADPDDAMLEYITEECQVFHVVGGYDEFAVTDRGVFYIPISVGTPLQPGSVEFRPIFSSEIANIRPIQVTEGLIFVDKSRTGIYAVSATGQTARPYISNEVNRLHRHLFDDVKSIAVSSGTSVFPSRQIYAVNDDGSVVVGQFNPDRDYIGWLRWEGDGVVKSITGNYGTVICMSVYTFDGVEVGVAEMLDYDRLCDCAQTFSTASFANFLELNDGSPLTLQDGSNLSLAGIVTGFYAGKTVELFAGGFFFGEVEIPVDGIISGYDSYGEITIGVGFNWVVHPLFTNFEGGQVAGQGEHKRKIEHMLATVRQTQEFAIGNRYFGSYRGGEDMSLPVPKRDDTYRYRETGRSYDPVVPITSTFPGTFKLIELATRITL